MAVKFQIKGGYNSVLVEPNGSPDSAQEFPVKLTVQMTQRNYEAYLSCAQAEALGKGLLAVAKLLESE